MELLTCLDKQQSDFSNKIASNSPFLPERDVTSEKFYEILEKFAKVFQHLWICKERLRKIFIVNFVGLGTDIVSELTNPVSPNMICQFLRLPLYFRSSAKHPSSKLRSYKQEIYMCFIMKGFLLSRTLLHIAKTIKIKENSLRLFSPPKGGFYNRKLRPSTIY